MSWITSHSALKEHPKRKRLSRLLGLDVYQTIGLLHCLWWWAMDYAPDGDLSRFAAADIADGLEYSGDPDELVMALQEAGLLDGLELHDWDEYGGKLYRRKEANAERMRAARAPGAEPAKATCNARATHVQNTCRAREEKSKKSKKNRYVLSTTHTCEAAPHDSSSSNTDKAVRQVFAHWQKVMNHPGAKLTPDRRTKIQARLREGIPLTRLLQAVDGCAASRYHMGENDEGRRYDSIELIFRNAGKVDQFADMTERRNGHRQLTDEEEAKVRDALVLVRRGRFAEAEAQAGELWEEVRRRG